jgi:cell division protein FtsL
MAPSQSGASQRATPPLRRRAAPPSQAAPAGAGLRVLGPKELAARERRRKVTRLTALSVVVLTGALLTVAGAQAVVADRQVRLDALEAQVANAVTRNQALQLQRAELSTPSRIMSVAERQLAMVLPATVSYLTPVDPGPSVASRSSSFVVPPATAPSFTRP